MAAVAIVAILALALVLGLGFIGGKNSTITTTELTTQILEQTQTQLQPITQTILSTAPLPASTSTSLATMTLTQTFQTTLKIPTTINLTRTESTLSTETTTENVTTTASGYVVLMPAGSEIIFSSGQRSGIVSRVAQQFGFNGFLVINFKTTDSSSVHWVLQGNSVNETSISQSAGQVEFPVQSYVQYSLQVFDDACNLGCNTAFNVTASIVYMY